MNPKTVSVRTLPPWPANPAHSAVKHSQLQPAPPPRPSPLLTGNDGGFEIENEKRGEAVDGEAAQDLALDPSSVSRLVLSALSSSRLLAYPLKNPPHARMAQYRL